MKKWLGTPIEARQDHPTLSAVCTSASLVRAISVMLTQKSMEEKQIIQKVVPKLNLSRCATGTALLVQ